LVRWIADGKANKGRFLENECRVKGRKAKKKRFLRNGFVVRDGTFAGEAMKRRTLRNDISLFLQWSAPD
jgi:hypothetical protein